MHRRNVAILLVAILWTTSALAQEKDVAGAKDHPVLTRMPGSYITSYDQKDFDSIESPYVSSGPDARWEGRATKIDYSMRTGAKLVSMSQIARNFEAALKKVGAKVLYSDGRVACLKLEKGGAKTYVQAAAFNDGRNYELLVVEAKAMQQEVVADAAALGRGIAAEGKVAVYGLYFDTNKAVVKPESEPTLVEIVKLLKQRPKLALFVVGHTDGVGGAEANVKLSNARAAAVVQALVSRGVSAARLKPAGAGPYCPVASNRTADGKAKNRRVELVERL